MPRLLRVGLPWALLVLAAPRGLPAFAAAGGALEVQVSAVNVVDLPQVQALVGVLEAGQSVKGLRRENFTLSEEAVGGADRRAIETFTVRSVLEGGQRLAVALVLDRSGSMKGAPLTAAREGAAEFLTRTSTGDMVAVVSFADAATVDCAATTDLDRVRAALGAIRAGGDTALYDAARAGVNTVSAVSEATRRAVVLLTDGKRTTGQLTRPEPVLALAGERGVRLFTIGMGPEPEHDVLKALAEGSGGGHYRAAKAGDILAAYQRVADRLQNEYVLTFHQERDPRFHRLSVTAVHGGATGAGERKYWPVKREEPAAAPVASAPPPLAAPVPDVRPAIAGVMALLALVLVATIVAARRRQR